MGKKNKTSLGNALLRNKKVDRGFNSTVRHTTEVSNPSKPDLKSITDETALNEFMSTAELADREFTAEKVNSTTIVTGAHIPGILTDEELDLVLQYQESNKEFLTIPRRPFWDSSTTPGQLEHAEKESFLHWRRQLALLGEKDDKIVLTPYEKNIDVWRQLWRVIERSDVVCQIVDGRNPLLFKCDDLESYVKEVDGSKENIVLINKADYLTEHQRKYWAEYFEKKKITVVFWSALMASIKEKEAMDEENLRLNRKTLSDEEDSSDNEAMEEEEHENVNEKEDDLLKCKRSKQNMEVDETDVAESNSDERTRNKELGTGDSEMGTGDREMGRNDLLPQSVPCEANQNTTSTVEEDAIQKTMKHSVLTRDELLKYFGTFEKPNGDNKEKIVIGMVGFPNVGKSSTINALIGDKKTSVSSTPGKTKHFQTINIDNNICLCDCPGLVFPTFVSTRAAMILNGVLPVDQLRDYRPPVTLLCKQIPRHVLEKIYGINIPRPGEAEDRNRPPTADEFLSAYSSMRGFMTSHGLPDCSRGARHIIKDFLKGKLLYCEPPPDINKTDYEPVQEIDENINRKKDFVNQQISGTPISSIDREFFSEPQSGVHYNAPTGMRGQKNDVSTDERVGKPWKKHFNRGKKEKLRRVMR